MTPIKSPSEDLSAQGARGVLQVVRQSSPESLKHHPAGRRYQEGESRYFQRFGLEKCPLTVLQLCESAGDDTEREGLEEMCRRIQAELVGVIVFSYGSRMARDEEHGARLVKLAAKHHVLFLVAGEVLNPRNRFQRAKLMAMVVEARLDNAERTWVFASSKYTKATSGELVTMLPTGLVWADPLRHGYRAMATEAILEEWIEPKRLETHRVRDPRPDGTIYILPNPYPDVFRSCQLAAKWMIETRDPTEVLHRIRHSPDYPRRGLFPSHKAFLFSNTREPGWDEADHDRIASWFRSPALYGIYRVKLGFLYDLGEIPEPLVWVEDAFPSLMRSTDWEVVRGAFKDPKRKFVTGLYLGPRNHRLPEVRCADTREDGTLCNAKFAANYSEGGTYSYASRSCALREHRNTYPADLDDVVLSILSEVFQPSALADAVNHLTRSADRSRDRMAHLNTQVSHLKAGLDYMMAREVEADVAGDSLGLEDWVTRRVDAQGKYHEAKTELLRLKQNHERVNEITEEEYRRIASLASDIGRLLDVAVALEETDAEQWRAGAGRHPMPAGYVRRLVGCLCKGVYVRNLHSVMFEVEVEFPSGVRLKRTCLPSENRPQSSQVERAWIAHLLRSGMDPGDVATELNSVFPTGRTWLDSQRQAVHWDGWSATLVQRAAVFYEHAEWVAPPIGPCETLGALAARTDVPLDRMWQAAFEERLGSARVDGDELVLAPTEEQLERAFVEYGRRNTAVRMGWPVEDVIRASDAAREIGCTREGAVNRAKRLSGQAKDLVGRVYVRRSDVCRENFLLSVALEHAPQEIRDLDQRYWTTHPELRKRIPGLAFSTVDRRAPSVSFGKRHRFFHVDEPTFAGLERAAGPPASPLPDDPAGGAA